MPGCPVMLEHRDGSMELVGLHEGHRAEVDMAMAAEAKSGITFWNHGRWQHCVARLGPMRHHLTTACLILARREYEHRMAQEGAPNVAGARRLAQAISKGKLREVLLHEPDPPPEIMTDGEAQLIAVQAEGRGWEALLVLMRTYAADPVVLRYSLEALARRLEAKRNCSVAAVTEAGACDIIISTLQRHMKNSHLVAGACWCLTQLAERVETSREILRCQGSVILVNALRTASQYGTFHLRAQAWGLSCTGVLVQNLMHKEAMIDAGLCEIMPQMISNHTSIMEDVQLQIWAMQCMLELAEDSASVKARLVEAGVVEAFEKVGKNGMRKDPEWLDLLATTLRILEVTREVDLKPPKKKKAPTGWSNEASSEEDSEEE